MTIHTPIKGAGPKYHDDLVQGSDEWLQARCGLLTASEMRLIVTPTLKVASNEKERAHLYELLAQRINKRVEPHYIGDDMLRGHAEEAEARYLYEQHYAPVRVCGFVTNDRWGFTLGCSPDGLVDEDDDGEGLIEAKSRRQKFQIETIVEHVAAGTIPDEYQIQVQTALLVTERQWCDFISYSNGMPMATVRVFPDPDYQAAILKAAAAFEAKLVEKAQAYADALTSDARLIPTDFTPPPGEISA